MYIHKLASSMTAFIIGAALLTAIGCADSSDSPQSEATPLPDGLFLTEAPGGVQAITDLKSTAKEGDEVVVQVIVGGKMAPIVEGRASASIIDASLANPCTSEDDHCKTPWDYCCTPTEDITANLANLQVLDDQGKVLSADLAPRIEPLSVLTVRGIVGPRPDAKVLTINATGIYIAAGASE